MSNDVYLLDTLKTSGGQNLHFYNVYKHLMHLKLIFMQA